MVTLTLFGGLSSVVAQDGSEASEPDGSALLSFSMPYPSNMTERPRVEFGEGRNLYRGEVLEHPIDSGAPRLSGTLRLSLDYDTHVGSWGIVAAGAVHIYNEDGAWRGTSLGYSRPGWSRRYHQYNLTGEDAYEGLTAMLFLIDSRSGFDVEGIVFPGELPPFPEPAEQPPRAASAAFGATSASAPPSAPRGTTPTIQPSTPARQCLEREASTRDP